ncbi:uncharacterized protein LOC109605197 [Aethina tumida]|uniref:uncharacterized protein LOC109605197 n=1 Tax=Aethina tumida TaxID=116153 RepID=UPI00096B2D1A|nr:uncharacterized protein LOC109605197 [Aethina tumida]
MNSPLNMTEFSLGDEFLLDVSQTALPRKPLAEVTQPFQSPKSPKQQTEAIQLPCINILQNIKASAQVEESLKEIENTQMHIINIIKNWKGGPIGIEDLAEKPLSPISVKKAFEALICLSTKDYVKLITDENSCIQTIEKGVKLE